MRHVAEFNEDEKNRLSELLAVCKATQGEYVGIFNRGWATSYSSEFVNAATEIFKILSNCNMVPSIRGHGSRYTLNVIFDLMATLFTSNGIRSCRKSAMTHESVRYLFEAHIHRKITKMIEAGW